MTHLSRFLRAWNTPDFNQVLKLEIEQLRAERLPLQQCLSTSTYALDDKFDVMVIEVTAEPGLIHARVGIFYWGIVAGCSCADDPTPVEPQSEYFELRISIDRATGQATVVPLANET